MTGAACDFFDPLDRECRLRRRPVGRALQTKKAAEIAFHQDMVEWSANPPVDNDNPTVTFLQHDQKHAARRCRVSGWHTITRER